MEKIKLHYLIGDTHFGGHDVVRVARANRILLDKTGAFDILMVSDDETLGDMTFDAYLGDDSLMESCQVFVFNCGNYRFNCKEEQNRLEKAVAAGAGFVFLHGDHPCYWVDAGMQPWPEIEKMAGLMWRNKTRHGDYADARVTVQKSEHPIMQGLTDFDTRDEIFCTCENVYEVPLEVLATAYSDPEVVSRHGLHGTGKEEPILTTGTYGKGRTVNHLLGHVWPYYTGHGLGENTMLSFAPRQFRQMLVRSCEWAATGKVEKTLAFTGEARLS
ncbi:MAG: ThuA domain-containing protein [Lachnospiraceae bacterium]|nr:ThuA domain-containing protein [Lachnospiraceae bacterium]